MRPLDRDTYRKTIKLFLEYFKRVIPVAGSCLERLPNEDKRSVF